MIRFVTPNGIVYIRSSAIIGVRVIDSPVGAWAEKGAKQVVIDCLGMGKYYSDSMLTEESANKMCNELLLDLGW